jgi:transcriptional regulator with XRE-family HTH domain
VPSAKVLFGRQVRILRIDRHLSQEKLSEMCDFHRNHVGRIERAERTITFDGVLRLAHALSVDPEVLWKLVPIPKRLPPKKKKPKDE